MTSARALGLFTLALLFLACRSKEVPFAEPVVDSGSNLGEATEAAPPAVDLLHWTVGATIAVSSNVDNPRDLPDHIADGKSETAWNGRTGDLVGGWIKVLLPSDAFVDTIELSAGFDKVTSEGDLFTMNHRIKRVRITRDGKLLREHVLDTNVRKPQPIPIKQNGGAFKIEILETVAGSKKEWRELCVSEIRAMGQAGTAALPSSNAPLVAVALLPHEVQAAINGTEAELDKLLGKSFPSIDAFCRAWDAKVDALLEARRASGDSWVPKDHRCKSRGPLVASFTPTADIKAVIKVTTYNVNWSEERFAIETSNGIVVPKTNPLESKNFLDPGCFGHSTVTVDSVTATGRALAIGFTDAWKNERTLYDEDGGTFFTSHDDVSETHLDCALGANGGATCTQTVRARVCHAGGSVVPCNSF